jgi:hypothetical protein
MTATNHADNVIDIHAHYQMNGGVQMFPWRIKAPAQSGERACLVIGCSDAPELFAGEAPPVGQKLRVSTVMAMLFHLSPEHHNRFLHFLSVR